MIQANVMVNKWPLVQRTSDRRDMHARPRQASFQG